MTECREHNSRIVIITFVVLFLSFMYVHQSSETLLEDLESLISSERDETNSVENVSKPTTVYVTSKPVPNHMSVHKSSLPARTNPVRFHNRLIDFNPHGNDTMVVIHIQKTLRTEVACPWKGNP